MALPATQRGSAEEAQDEEGQQRQQVERFNLAALAAHRRELTGRQEFMFRSYDARSKGEVVKTPAAPPALSLLGHERTATAFPLSVGSTAKPFAPVRRVGGRATPHVDVARLMTADAPVFLLVDPPASAADLQQPAADSRAYLFHAAAVAATPGVLAGTSSLPLSQLADARVQPGAALAERLVQLAVASRNGLDAARTVPVLVSLASDAFVTALHLAGTSILAPGLTPRIVQGEGGELGWLRHVTGLAEDATAGAKLLAIATQLINTGFLTEVTLRSAVIHSPAWPTKA